MISMFIRTLPQSRVFFCSKHSDSDEDDDCGGENAGEDDPVGNQSAVLSAEDKEKEAAEMRYKVIGPLGKSDWAFKRYEPVFAVVQIGSHQFKVSNGDTIYTERLKFCDVNDKMQK